MKNFTLFGITAAALVACDGPTNPEGNQTVAGVPTGPATQTNTSAPGSAPRIQTGDEFVQVASASNRFEIESSRLALQKAQSPEVKRYAQMMIDEHTRATNELKTVAGSLRPPLVPKAQFNPKQTADMAKLQSTPAGAAFDGAYMTAQAEGHAATLAAMRDYASGGEVAELKTIGAKMTPIVERHLQDVQRMQAAMGG